MIEHWIINALIFSIAPMTYICFHQYKDIKKLKQLNEAQNNYIKHLEKK